MGAVILWAWDDTNKIPVKIKTDSEGRLYTVAVIDELDDIGDVYVPSPTDLYILYWDNGNSRWACRAISDWSVVMKTLFDAYTILYADTDNTPAALVVAASRLIGRKSSGGITTLAAADIFTLLGITASAAELNVLDGIPGTLTAAELGYVDGVTSAIQTQLDAKIAKATLDAYSILAADTDNTPMAVALAVSQLIGRKSSGGIVALAKADILTIINVVDGATKYPDTGEQAFLDADHTKLDGIEAAADVTDTANVNALVKRIVYVKVLANDTALATGDGKAYITIPSDLNGMNLIDADAAVYTKSSSGLPAISLERSTDFGSSWNDMLSTGITIDENEYSSYVAATPPVINGSYDDVATGNWIRVNVDTAGTGTKGLDVILVFQTP